MGRRNKKQKQIRNGRKGKAQSLGISSENSLSSFELDFKPGKVTGNKDSADGGNVGVGGKKGRGGKIGSAGSSGDIRNVGGIEKTTTRSGRKPSSGRSSEAPISIGNLGFQGIFSSGLANLDFSPAFGFDLEEVEEVQSGRNRDNGIQGSIGNSRGLGGGNRNGNGNGFGQSSGGGVGPADNGGGSGRGRGGRQGPGGLNGPTGGIGGVGDIGGVGGSGPDGNCAWNGPGGCNNDGLNFGRSGKGTGGGLGPVGNGKGTGSGEGGRQGPTGGIGGVGGVGGVGGKGPDGNCAWNGPGGCDNNSGQRGRTGLEEAKNRISKKKDREPKEKKTREPVVGTGIWSVSKWLKHGK